jgi:hypothetical protein
MILVFISIEVLYKKREGYHPYQDERQAMPPNYATILPYYARHVSMPPLLGHATNNIQKLSISAGH